MMRPPLTLTGPVNGVEWKTRPAWEIPFVGSFLGNLRDRYSGCVLLNLCDLSSKLALRMTDHALVPCACKRAVVM